MPFTPKAWQNGSAGGTPINDDGLIDMEERLSDYTDAELVGVGCVLTWDGSSNYIPASLRTDTSRPREFRGPTDPATIGTITLADYDTWVPTA